MTKDIIEKWIKIFVIFGAFVVGWEISEALGCLLC